MLKVITVTNQPERTQPLIKSLNKFGWDSVMLVTEWKGFGTKLIETYNYLKDNPEVDRFIFCDAHDVICLGAPEEFESKLEHPDKMLISAERGLWPGVMQQYEKYYDPLEPHRFNYVNSGLYYSPAHVFIALMDASMPKYADDDQEWLGRNFLFNDDFELLLDRKQKIFNSHSFIDEGEYGYENNRVQIMGNEPLFCHFNGSTIDPKFNELIKL